MIALGTDELHLMLDLETVSSRPDAAISQIGGCLFCPRKAEPIIKTFSYHVDVQSCLDVGMVLDWGTMRWWMRQEDIARAAFQKEDTLPIKDALRSLSAGSWTDIKGIWSHGITFDLVILDNAFRRCGMKVPWHFKAARDTRTILWLVPNATWPENKVKHSAVHDATAQALVIVDALRKMGVADVA